MDTDSIVNSVCAYCGVGCGLELHVTAARSGPPVIARTIGRADHPVNRGRLCTKGITTADLLAAPGRMTQASIRHHRDGGREAVDVDEAIAHAGRRLREIAEEHGPDSIALYVSGQMSLESQYLATKLAKGFLRTKHLESNSRLCMASAGTGYKQSLGADGPPGSYEDLDHADLFLVVGANMADCHPILFLRMMERVKAGAKLVVVDPRRTATAEKADLHLQIAPGTDLSLLNGLLQLLIEADAIDRDFIADYTEGFDDLAALAADYPVTEVARTTGLAADDIRTLARWIGGADNWMTCWTMGLNQSTHGTWHTNAICNLHLATGAICRTGSGPFSLTGQPNAMGGREMGYMGPGLPGQRTVLAEADRDVAEDLWQIPRGTVRTDVGTGTIDMFDQMAAGAIKACWIICTNPVASVANRTRVVEALQRCELVIVQDVFDDNETLPFADVALPAALWTEADGVMVNSERTLSLHQAAVPPPGAASPDWQLIARVACAMGYGGSFSYPNAETVFEEIKQFWNPKTGWDIRGASYDRLRETPLQWPCPPDAAERNPVRYRNDGRSQTKVIRADGFDPEFVFPTPRGRAIFHARPALPPAELPDDDHPLVLNTGRVAHQWHTRTKTGRVPKLSKLNPGPFLEVNPVDAETYGIAEGAGVRVTSRRGTAVLPAVVTDRVRPGNCFAPFHWSDLFGPDVSVNAVTNDAVDPESLQPEFKYCAVELEAVPVTDHTPPGAPSAGADGLSAALGLDSPPSPPTLSPTEELYVAGVLAGLAVPDAAPGAPVLSADAPLRPDVRVWVNGVLAGAFSRSAAPDMQPAPDVQPSSDVAPTIEVLWASQTGTVEDFAPTVAAHLDQRGVASAARAMDSAGVAALAAGGTALFVTSTTGDGDPPDNATTLWSELTADDAPSLTGLRYAVLAFGDPSYDEFCGFGRKLDDRLAELGATRLVDRADCAPEFEMTAAEWLTSVTDTVATTAPARTAVVAVERGAPSPPVAYGRKNPLVTSRIRNTPLTAPGSAKDVRQIGLALPANTLTYEAGDALAVMPRNNPHLVEQVLELTGLDGDEPVTVGDDILSMATALTEKLEIAKITPALLGFINDRHHSDELTDLLAHTGTRAFDDWTWGRQLADVLVRNPVRASTTEWLSVLKPMTARQYSISSSPKENPHEVQLTVSAVRYNLHGTPRHGVCSTYLADHATDSDITMWVQPARHFGPPAEVDVPMIMVGPGTGIAPFRGFLHERRALGHTGRNWLFFGEQHAATDFYYRDELERFCAEGTLDRLDLAFSRDQERKIYVQDRMLEYGADIWRWLNDGAHFYVCGDKARMARDVDETLKLIVATHGKLSGDSAEAYVKALAAEQRYVRDVY